MAAFLYGLLGTVVFIGSVVGWRVLLTGYHQDVVYEDVNSLITLFATCWPLAGIGSVVRQKSVFSGAAGWLMGLGGALAALSIALLLHLANPRLGLAEFAVLWCVACGLIFRRQKRFRW